MTGQPKVILYGRLELDRFEALAQGCAAMGWVPVLQRASHFRPADAIPDAFAVVTHGVGKEGRPIAETYRRLGVPIWILELPRLRDVGGEHALLLDSLHWLPEGVSGRPVPALPKVAKTSGQKFVLVAMQTPGDAAHGMNVDQVEDWTRHTVAFVQTVTGKRVVVRPHPKHPRPMPADCFGAAAISDPRAESVRDALAKAAGVVTYNSTVGWDAIVAGVPVVALAPSGHCAYARYTTTLAELAPLPDKARTEALARVANTQWTLDEFRDGTAIRAMMTHHLTRAT